MYSDDSQLLLVNDCILKYISTKFNKLELNPIYEQLEICRKRLLVSKALLIASETKITTFCDSDYEEYCVK